MSTATDTLRCVTSVEAIRALIVDIDGVVSPVHGETAWGDDTGAGHAFGPIAVSRAMCARLDALAETDDLSCWWLTSCGVRSLGRGWTRSRRGLGNLRPHRPISALIRRTHIGM